MQVTLLSPDERFLSEGRRKMSGFDHFSWIISDRSISEVRSTLYLKSVKIRQSSYKNVWLSNFETHSLTLKLQSSTIA